MSEPLPPVPPEVDVVEVAIYFDMNPAEVATKVNKNMPAWLRRAAGRPVVLRWVSRPSSDWTPTRGRPHVAPGTIKRCAELAEQYGLAGLTFDHFGPRPDANWSVPIEQLPTALTEVQELSKAYGFMQK